MLLPIHVLAGGLAILTGALALIAAKGSRVHRRGGLVFVYAMVIMGLSGAVLAVLHASYVNVLGGLTSVYFVTTALATVRRLPPSRGSVDAVAAAGGATIVAVELGLAAVAIRGGHWMFRGIPVPMLIFLALVTLTAVIGDIRVVRYGFAGGAGRLRRHLWRMCFALFIAAGSFFSIRARVAHVLPAPFLSTPARIVPIVLPFVAMLYWAWRIPVVKTRLPLNTSARGRSVPDSV
jgi:hypothetical protein